MAFKFKNLSYCDNGYAQYGTLLQCYDEEHGYIKYYKNCDSWDNISAMELHTSDEKIHMTFLPPRCNQDAGWLFKSGKNWLWSESIDDWVIQLAKDFHPPLNNEHITQEQFKKLFEAYHPQPTIDQFNKDLMKLDDGQIFDLFKKLINDYEICYSHNDCMCGKKQY